MHGSIDGNKKLNRSHSLPWEGGRRQVSIVISGASVVCHSDATRFRRVPEDGIFALTLFKTDGRECS
jgi:hypothetical protein